MDPPSKQARRASSAAAGPPSKRPRGLGSDGEAPGPAAGAGLAVAPGDADFWPAIAPAALRAFEGWLGPVLPPRLRERTRIVRAAGGLPGARAAAAGAEGRRFVLYWARGVALRGHENPALDVAKLAAAALGLPLVAHFGLPEKSSTARRHRFLLEGWAELARDLEAQGVVCTCHVARPGSRGPLHLTLAHRAALVVSDEPWTNPYLRHARQVAGAKGDGVAPLVLVDTQCVVPAGLVPLRKDLRAFLFEAATKDLRKQRIDALYEEVAWAAPAPAAAAAVRAALPFAPDDVSSDARIRALIQAATVDHRVAALPHTRGGASHAARRWEAWLRAGGLKTYAARRNNPLDKGGSSRMSAYLNAGMASPFAVARTCKGASGSAKFKLEFQTWRELSYAFCFRRPATHNTLAALPQWAQSSLKAHAGDDRELLLTLEEIEACKTNEPLWNAMQQALAKTGELHNNCRMTWGKAIHCWSSSPGEALARLEFLNNKYALDGFAPPSYGGILWCFGGFDSPAKAGENPVIGKVKARPVSSHQRRLSPKALLQKNGCHAVERPNVLALLRRGTAAEAEEDGVVPSPVPSLLLGQPAAGGGALE